MEYQQEIVCGLSVTSKDLPKISKARHYSTLNISETVKIDTYLQCSTNRKLHTPCSSV